MSLKAFGERVGIGTSSAQRIEVGINNPSEQTIRAVCQQFNVNRHWLETGEGEMYEPSPADLIDSVAHEHGFGPAKHALLRACLRVLDELGPDALDRIVAELKAGIPAGSTFADPGIAARRAAPAGGDLADPGDVSDAN